jgi:hypothetical protein
MKKPSKLAKVAFQDNTGKYVTAQPPNVLVYVMAVAFVGQMLSSGKIHTFFDLLFFGAAFAWSYLEIRFGESMFRRIMGLIVLLTIFITRLV